MHFVLDYLKEVMYIVSMEATQMTDERKATIDAMLARTDFSKEWDVEVISEARKREIRVCQSPAYGAVVENRGFCNCCGKKVTLLTDVQLGESVCNVCRSYDVRRAA